MTWLALIGGNSQAIYGRRLFSEYFPKADTARARNEKGFMAFCAELDLRVVTRTLCGCLFLSALFVMGQNSRAFVATREKLISFRVTRSDFPSPFPKPLP